MRQCSGRVDIMNRIIPVVYMLALAALVAFPSITMAAVPTVTNQNAGVNGVVTLYGNITATGVGGDDDERGFVWGLFSFPDCLPGYGLLCNDCPEEG